MRIDKRHKDRRILTEGSMTFIDVQWYPSGHCSGCSEVGVISDEGSLVPVSKVIKFFRSAADMLERCEATKGKKGKKGKGKR